MTPATTRFARRFLPVWAVGVLGALGLLLQGPPAALLEQAPALRELAPGVVRLLLLVQPILLVTVLAATGAALAHRIGLRSRLAGEREAQLAPVHALAAGLAVAAVLAGVDAAWAGALGPDWQRAAAAAAMSPWWQSLAIGVLYGGLAEEVMMRWGLMSLVAWGLWRLSRPQGGAGAAPGRGVMWAAIGLSAAVFALGHLPALAQSVPLSPALVARTVVLNTLGGVVYGWLFWRRSLESAMVAHASTHVGLAVVRSLS